MNNTDNSSSTSFDPWITSHGVLMSLAWGILVPLGILASKNRFVFQQKKCLGLDVWFHFHRFLQFVAWFFMLAAFVISFTKMGDPTQDGPVGASHKILGIIVFSMGGVQVLLGIFRPVLSSPIRGLWFLVHSHWGTTAMVVAWVNMYLGIIEYGYTPDQWGTVIGVVMVILIIVFIVNYSPKEKTVGGDSETMSDFV